MSTDEILELELSLLLINYGERKVLRSLAKVNGLNDNELETKLKRIHQLEKKPASRKSKDPSKAVDEIISRQSRSFLPEMRDIKRLFHRHSLEPKNLKSRSTSASKVFQLLASLDEKELEEFTQEQDKTNYSSLGIISDEIMKRG
jgi:hypothetical protein